MPFEAAKAVAATFCWRIRYALTPIFGVEFLSLCIPPDDSRFGRMIIDPSIVREAAIAANQYRTLEGKQRAKVTGVLSSPHTPETLRHGRWNKKDRRPKPSPRTEETENGYGTDTETSERHSPSPPALRDNNWVPANNSRAAGMVRCDLPSVARIPSELPFASLASLRNETARLRYGAKTDSFSAAAEDSTETKPHFLNSDDDVDDDQSFTDSSDSEEPVSARMKTLSPLPLTNDARAAYLLMRLQMQDAIGEDEPTRKRRRAST